MNATTLAGRRLLSEYGGRFGEFEAGLSIGLLQPDAFKLVAGPVAGDALLPALDQTRTVGLVTLPGAFVGMVLGGASPTAAAALQLVVLIGLLAAESIAILTTTELLARSSLPDGRTVSVMSDDKSLLHRIDELVAEEHELRTKHAAGDITDEDERHPPARPRGRARPVLGPAPAAPRQARVRRGPRVRRRPAPADTVEGYLN